MRTKKNCSPLNTDLNRKKLSRWPLSVYNDTQFSFHRTKPSLCNNLYSFIQLVRFFRFRDTLPSSFPMIDQPPG